MRAFLWFTIFRTLIHMAQHKNPLFLLHFSRRILVHPIKWCLALFVDSSKWRTDSAVEAGNWFQAHADLITQN